MEWRRYDPGIYARERPGVGRPVLLRLYIAGMTRFAAILLAAAVVACGEPDGTPDAANQATPVINNSPASVGEATFAESLDIDLANFEHSDAGLYWQDVVVGEGPVVTAGQVIDAHYTGWLPDGTEFDSSKGGPPISFPIGVGAVIKGWDQGVVGMNVGGTRKLIIPGPLAYGPNATGPIPANATLVFTVEVVAAR